MIKNRKIYETNSLYLILGIVLYFVGSYVQKIEINLGLLITEYILILLPNLIYIGYKRYDFKDYLRLRRINIKQFGYTLGIIILAYPLAIFLNIIGLNIILQFTDYMPESVPLPDNIISYISSIFVIGISPGICEEIMFRGTILRGYEGLGRKRAIIISGVLFGFFHLNIQNLLGPIFLGIILGNLVEKSGSIYPAIIGHTLNNSLAMTLGYLINKNMGKIENNELSSLSYLNPLNSLIIGIFFLGLILYTLIKLIEKFPKGEQIYRSEDSSGDWEEVGFWEYLPLAMFLILFIWVNGRVYFNIF